MIPKEKNLTLLYAHIKGPDFNSFTVEKWTNYGPKYWSILLVLFLSLSRDLIWLWNQQDYFRKEVLFSMGKGYKTWSFVFNLTAWYNLFPCCNVLWGSFKRYHRAWADSSAGECFSYVLGRCCVPTLRQGRRTSTRYKRKIFSHFWKQSPWFSDPWAFVGCVGFMFFWGGTCSTSMSAQKCGRSYRLWNM